MARDRDRARQAVLESLGWTIHRIWSTDWFRNPQEQLSRVVVAIEKARRRADAKDRNSMPDPSAEHEETSRNPDVDTENEGTSPEDSQKAPAGRSSSNGETSTQNPSDGKAPTEHATSIERADESEHDLSISEPYEAASLDIQVSVSLHEVSASQLATWVRRVVQTESPVYAELVARRIMNAAGVSRLGRRIKEAVRSGIDHAARQGWIEEDDGVLSLPDQRDLPVRDRSDADSNTRDIEMVPPPEIATAALTLTEDSFGVDTEDLVRQVSYALGFEKMGSNIRDRIERVVEAMEDQGLLSRENGHLVVGSKSA